MKRYIKSAVTPLDDESMQIKLMLAMDPSTRLDTLRQLAEVSGPMIRRIIHNNPAAAPLVEQHPELFEFDDETVEKSTYWASVWSADYIDDSILRSIDTRVSSMIPSEFVTFTSVSVVDATEDEDEEEGYVFDVYTWFSTIPSFEDEIAECINEALESRGVEILSAEFT